MPPPTTATRPLTGRCPRRRPRATFNRLPGAAAMSRDDVRMPVGAELMATSDTPGVERRRREGWRRFAPPWARILAGGVALFLLVEKTLSATGNPNYVPSVIVLGAFTVPVAFVAYVYDQPAGFDVPLPTLAVCALW